MRCNLDRGQSIDRKVMLKVVSYLNLMLSSIMFSLSVEDLRVLKSLGSRALTLFGTGLINAQGPVEAVFTHRHSRMCFSWPDASGLG